MKAHAPPVATFLLTALALAGCRKDSEPKPLPEPVGQQQAPTPAAPSAPTPVQLPPAPVALASLAPLVESVKAAVVSVEVRARGPAGRAGLPGDVPWGRPSEPRGIPGPGPRQPGQGLGSGFIIDAAGLVLTNHHVVRDARVIQVRLADGRGFGAEVLGTDPLTDVALLQLQGEPKELPVVKLGDAEALRVGDWVLAIGNPFGLASSVSLGILSAKARNIQAGPYDEFLQTDAAINPGNSGGPLFNLQGEVVGINTAIVGGGTGIGFAVPANLVRALLPQLRDKGAVTRGWLGLGTQDVSAALAEALGLPVKAGALVVQVEEDTPAAKAGLAADDVITAINGEPVESAGDLTRTIGRSSPGAQVKLTIYRGQEQRELPVTLGTRPDLEGVQAQTKPRERPETRAERQRNVGVSFTDVDPRLAQARGLPEQGALVVEVAPGSAADQGGLVPGMVVVEAGGQPVRGAEDLARRLHAAKPGEVLVLRVQAGNTRLLRAVTVPQ